MKKSLLLVSALFMLYTSILKGQNNAPPLPQRTATATVTQDLSFGAISLESGSSGGTVTVDYTGSRTSTGSVYLLDLNYPVGQAILEFHLCPGRSVKVLFDPLVQLKYGSYGMNLTINRLRIGTTLITTSGQSFISNKGCNDTHYIEVGGELTVGNLFSNPPGEYLGSFSVTLAQE
ncbi:MAG TPA: DUF4402 domain-containing protein [Bacteroidales bacterium]|nr:DUF4402 domain-containing protein [Bacteroidales bacterium]